MAVWNLSAYNSKPCVRRYNEITEANIICSILCISCSKDNLIRPVFANTCRTISITAHIIDRLVKYHFNRLLVWCMPVWFLGVMLCANLNPVIPTSGLRRLMNISSCCITAYIMLFCRSSSYRFCIFALQFESIGTPCRPGISCRKALADRNFHRCRGIDSRLLRLFRYFRLRFFSCNRINCCIIHPMAFVGYIDIFSYYISFAAMIIYRGIRRDNLTF